MNDHVFNVLFLGKGNSARSIIAEAILSRVGIGKLKAFSAEAEPKGEVHPFALQLLKSVNHDTTAARSKSWEEFAAPGSPEMHFVFIVSDDVGEEVTKRLPGQPMVAHWSLPRSRGGRGHGSRKAPCLCRHLPHAEQPHLGVHQPADEHAGQARLAGAARRDRTNPAESRLSGELFIDKPGGLPDWREPFESNDPRLCAAFTDRFERAVFWKPYHAMREAISGNSIMTRR